jgi:hypothetical protein
MTSGTFTLPVVVGSCRLMWDLCPRGFAMQLSSAAVGAAATLFGVLLTGMLGFLFDRTRRQWDDSRRWLSDRRQIYSEFLATANLEFERLWEYAEVFFSADVEIKRARERGNDVSPSEEWQKASEQTRHDEIAFKAWKERLAHALAEIDLIATDPVRRAARRHYEVTAIGFTGVLFFLVGGVYRGENQVSRETLDRFYDSHQDSRDHFRLEAQRELLIKPVHRRQINMTNLSLSRLTCREDRAAKSEI